MLKWCKRMLGAGLLAGAVYAVWRLLDERSRASTLEWRPQPFPSPPMPVPHAPDVAPVARADDPESPWVEPNGNHCPTSHPVKAKLTSGIYHSPGGQMYERTAPDRCYRDAEAAEADGLRASKR